MNLPNITLTLALPLHDFVSESGIGPPLPAGQLLFKFSELITKKLHLSDLHLQFSIFCITSVTFSARRVLISVFFFLGGGGCV